jgi:hypothetical protein
MEVNLNYMQLLLLAALAESVGETLKMVWLPLFIPFAGPVFTRIIASRGANFLHDLFKIAEWIKLKSKAWLILKAPG